MDFQLLIVKGRSASDALKLADGVTTLGRHDECQIRIKSSQVSRRHCEFFEKKGLLIVKDLGSSNGTFVNGKKVQGQQVLEPGDELTIGQVTLRVGKIGEVPPIKTPAPPAAGDTAVVEAIAVPSDGGDDDFEIDFDTDPAAEDELFTPPAPEAAALRPAPAEAKPAAKKTADPEKKPVAGSDEPDMADQAIADFLLDIKLDDDE